MRVATDVGGTFTDLVYLDETSGELGTAKASTTPANFAEGIMETFHKSALDIPSTRFFVHGSTIIINALTERKGAKTALITTKGFKDVLEIGRANRPDMYNLSYVKPKPFVPRYLRLEVGGRMNYRGEELVPLDEADLRRAVEFCRQEAVEAIAICFLHSYANPSHEMRARELIQELAPEIPVTASYELSQEWREYERTNTAVLNSYVLPTARFYLSNLEQNLANLGMGRVYHLMQSNGGTATFEMGQKAPINAVESGPVAGVIGATVIGKLLGGSNVISFDVGGTTAKTSLVKNGTPRLTTEYKIEWRSDFAGYPILAPTIDIVEIGAGGGSIAWVDDGGALRIGPVSAGADPGPACYGLGGDQPTVTDANVLAGRINPRYFLGGEIDLDVDSAQRAMQPLADHFGLSLEETAMGIIRLADANMVNALKLVSVRRGHDPREFVLVAFGGGGAMHAAALARELRVKKVIVPTHPGVFSAWGMLMTDLRQDLVRTTIRRTDRIEPADLTGLFAEMEAQARRHLLAQGASEPQILFQRFADMRYKGQEHTVKVPIPAGEIGPPQMPEIDERFHQLHEQAYTFRLETPIELVNYHLSAFGVVDKADLQKLAPANLTLAAAQKGERRVNFDELGFQTAAIYERDRLPLNTALAGPLVIEEPTSTTVVFPDQQVVRDEYGFLHIEMLASQKSTTMVTHQSGVICMESGFFSLQPLYEHAKQDIPPPKGDGRGAEKHPAWSRYSQVRNEIMADVPAITGWYIWLQVSGATIEEIRYVGKTTQKKMASLQSRLYDHFKRERYSFWGKGKFSGCTHLAWVGYENLPNEHVESVERHLIKWFEPTDNKVRAKPQGELELAEEVKRMFETLFRAITKSVESQN